MKFDDANLVRFDYENRTHYGTIAYDHPIDGALTSYYGVYFITSEGLSSTIFLKEKQLTVVNPGTLEYELFYKSKKEFHEINKNKQLE